MENEERNLKTEALVEEEEGCGLIRDKKFKVIQPGLIAVDHAAIIVQAFTLLKNVCNALFRYIIYDNIGDRM